jgi:hypothetical protein
VDEAEVVLAPWLPQDPPARALCDGAYAQHIQVVEDKLGFIEPVLKVRKNLPNPDAELSCPEEGRDGAARRP